jgi:hypothetical protein
MTRATLEEKAEIIAVAEELKKILGRLSSMSRKERLRAKRDLRTGTEMIEKFRRLHPDD